MNTKLALDAARREKIHPIELQAHVVWALVSQMGRTPLEVGEVASLVKQTSGYKPSTYQTNNVLKDLQYMCVVGAWDLRANAKGMVKGWVANEKALALLDVHRWVFGDLPEVHQAMVTLLSRVDMALDAVRQDLESYNHQLDEEAVIHGNES